MGGRCRGNYFYGRRRGFRSPSQYFMSQEEEKKGEGCRGDYAGDPEGGKEP